MQVVPSLAMVSGRNSLINPAVAAPAGVHKSDDGVSKELRKAARRLPVHFWVDSLT